MPRRFLCAAVVLASLSLAACAQETVEGPDWLVDPVQAQQLGFSTRWVADLKLPITQRIDYAKVIGDQMICIERPTSLVSAISLRDGRLLWQRVVGGPTDRLFEPFERGGRIVVNSNDRVFTIDPRTGQIESVSELDQMVGDAPAVRGDLAIFGGLNGRVFAHDVKIGYKVWAYDMTAAVQARPIIVGDSVFVADLAGRYALLNASTGVRAWHGRTFGPITGKPASSSIGIFVASHDQTLYCLNRAQGDDRWKYPTTSPLREDVALIGRTVYLFIPPGELQALDAITGEPRWTMQTAARPIAQYGQHILLRDKNALLSVDETTGELVDELPVQKRTNTVLTGPEDSLIIVTNQGQVTRLDRFR